MAKAYTTYQKEIAFDRYYAMGARRDLLELSKNLVGTQEFIDRSPSHSILKKWSMSDNWQERATLRDIENSKKQEAKTDREVVNTKADYRKDIRLTLQPVKGAISTVVVEGKDGKPAVSFKIENAKDFSLMVGALDKLAKLDLLMMGEADSRPDVASLIDVLRAGREKSEGE